MADDQIAQIITGLADDGVYISPKLVSVSPAQEAQIVANVASSQTPVFAIGLPLNFGDTYGGDGEQVAALIVDRTHQDGVYLVAGRDGSLGMSAVAYGSDAQDLWEISWVAKQQAPDDQGQQLVIATDLIRSGEGHKVYNELSAEQEKNTSASTTKRDSDGTSASVIAVSGVVLAIAILSWLVHRWMSTVRRRQDLGLTRTVLERVASARNDEWRTQADKELLAFSARIDKSNITAQSSTDAWRAALDHYDAARQVLDRSTATADTVGALVLLERGNAALDAAIAGNEFIPSTPCYFNPFHGNTNKTVTWGAGHRTVTVPACNACRLAVRKKREPDFLDLAIDGKSVHYYDSKAEPWASTGYGALNTDLIGMLKRLRNG